MLFPILIIGLNATTSRNDQHASSEKPLSITVQATSVSNALRELSAVSRVPLVATPHTAANIIAFRFQKVTLSEARLRIAEALHAEWIQNGQGYRLDRSNTQDLADQTRELNQAVENIRSAINTRVEGYRHFPEWDDKEAEQLANRMETMFKQLSAGPVTPRKMRQALKLGPDGPIERALTSAVSHMDPETLAEIPLHGKGVWSNRPTAVQEPMPASVQPAIDDFVLAQKLWSQAAVNHCIGAWLSNGRFGSENTPGEFSTFMSPEVGIVLLTAERSNSASGLTIQIAAFDESGLKISEAHDNFLPPPSHHDLDQRVSDLVASEGNPMSEDAINLLNCHLNKGPTNLDTKLLFKLNSPERFDPLCLCISPALTQISEWSGVNMVAYLPDSAFNSVLSIPSDDLTARALLTSLGDSLSFTTHDGWLIAKPIRPHESREDFANREILGKYLRLLMTGKPLSLDEQASIALALPDPKANPLPTSMVEFLPAEIDKTPFPDRDTLRFYGMLSAEQRTALTMGGLPISGMTAEALDCIKQMVYGAEETVSYAKHDQSVVPTDVDKWVVANHNVGLLRETTECLPMGIPPNGVITLKTTESPTVLLSSLQRLQVMPPALEMTAKQLAWQKYAQDHAESLSFKVDPSNLLDTSQLQFGRPLHLTFRFQFTPDLVQYRWLEDKSVGDIKTVTIDQLPDDFKAAFSQKYQEYLSTYPKKARSRGKSSPPPAHEPKK